VLNLRAAWTQALALFDRPRRLGGIDLLILAGLAGLFFEAVDLVGQWTHELRPSIAIDLDEPWALPRYTLFSLFRGLIAYALSLAFTLAYGSWAAKDRAAERVLLPLLDVLQSIPVLSFLPGLVLLLVAAFPRSNVGLELAAVLMIFTGQAWNMTFSFYHSLRSVPADLREAAAVYRFSRWQCFKWLELPSATVGLVWNSMMSLAGGWFFLMMIESFRLGTRDFRLPGVGSYMSVAVEQDRPDAMLRAILAMALMILALDQLLMRPVVVWSQRFRVEEGGQQPAASSWFLTWLRRSHLVALAGGWLRRLRLRERPKREDKDLSPRPASSSLWQSLSLGRRLSRALLLVLLAALAYGAWRLLGLVSAVSLRDWAAVGGDAGRTLGRVLLSTALGTLWAVPAGLAIGLSPRLARVCQPVVQLLASFPGPMLFTAVIAVLSWAGVPLGWGSVLLMLLGTQWYILFNVVAGAMAVPADLREATRSYLLNAWERFRTLYLPAVFPYLVTGWVTAAGGAWNASIAAEYVSFRGRVLSTPGLGSRISEATERGDFPLLAASTVVMAVVVVAFNRTVWRRLYRLAETRFALGR
jgi:NitT/TauT family transport system permease protein